MSTLIRLAGVALLALVGAASSGRAQQTPAQVRQAAAAESTLDAHTREVAAQLRCPVCQGLSIQDSPSELAQEMRDLVKQQLAAGKTQQEVKDYFVGRYGEWILMAPQAHGFNWFAYVAPFVLLVGGGAALWYALRKWTRSQEQDAVEA